MSAILSAVHSQPKESHWPTKYKNCPNNLIFDGIEFPVTVEDMPNSGKNNGIKVNLFRYEEGIKVISFTRRKNAIGLLLISDFYLHINTCVCACTV